MAVHYLSFCAIVKEEGPYLAEWLAYHRLMGVEKFIIYDNNSTDNTWEILKPYVKCGLVEYLPWPVHPGQLAAYNDCIERWRRRSYWMAFVDLDEFVIPVRAATLPTALQPFEQKNGLAINTLIYGPSRHKRRPVGLQIENYLYRAETGYSDNRHIKTIANLSRVLNAGTNPHFVIYQDGFTAADEEGNPVPQGAFSKETRVNHFRINHYMTRSEEEFKIKLLRGRATTKAYRPQHLASPHLYDLLNTTHDPIMTKYVPAVQETLEASLLSNRPVYIRGPHRTDR